MSPYRSRRSNAAVALLLLALPIATSVAHAALQELEPADTLERRIDALVTPYLDAGMFSGVVLIAEGQEIRLVKAYGQASYELGVALVPSSRFRIASLSKQFTNAALAVLMDSGALMPSSRVSEFLPEFPRGEEIQLAHLVGHTSGVPHTNTLEELKGVTNMKLEEIIDLLSSKDLDFKPGSKTRYSNGGYDVLAAVIESVAGVPFEDFLRENVLEALDLDDTGRLHTYEVIPGIAQGYLPGRRKGEHTRARFYPAELRVGGGSLYSTAEDVFRLFRSTFQREFASEEASDFLFWDPTQRYEITGRSPGFVAKVFIDIPGDITVVSLANNYSNLNQWGRRLFQAAVNAPWPCAPLNFTDRFIPASQASAYSGRFVGPEDTGLLSRTSDGQLLYEDLENDWRVGLFPLSNGRYLHPFFDMICRFEGDGAERTMLCRPVLEGQAQTWRFERTD